jgi:Zn finger protein HypA/HybF involved in hydrogenase expression
MELRPNRPESRLGDGYFECLDCTHRLWSASRVADCPACGQPTVNIGVARE